MLLHRQDEDRFGRLQDRLRDISAVTPDLVHDVLAEGGSDSDEQGTKQARRIDALIGWDAWVEVALAVLALELPEWTVRRLVREDGEWHCTLSRNAELPACIDPTAEGSHQVLPLAILAASLAARRLPTESSLPAAPTWFPPEAGWPMCCDDFA
jgi:hypothetical protein